EDEYLPYLITEQAKVQQATPQQRNAVQRLIDHIVRAVKGWVVRTLSKYDTTYKMSRRVAESLTPADILYMAERMVGEVAKYEKPISPNKQSGMARREFLGLLGAGVGVAALGGGATLIDQSIKNNTKEAAKEKVNSLADNVYNELIKQLNKSDAFVKLAKNIAKAKPSNIGKNAAINGFYSITDTYRMEKMYANNEKSNLIDTGLRYKDDGTPIFVSRDDVLKKASDTHALLSENEQKIIAIMSDAIGFVEAITGHNFKKLDIKATTNTPVADILARKKLGLKNHDTNINALVENNNPNVVLIHPQTMANLVSTNEKARLHAFQTLSHELVHVLQNQENGVASNKGIGVNIDTPVLLKNMISNILGNEYSSSEQIQNETEAFHVGYLATKALLLKEGKPLSTISKDEFLNII
ncbi:MAG TPA: hypothetical protein PLY05_13455, partial [Agitococcus sp.]|nr:hypothetical protein [Agitococcus sp.]